MTTMNNAPKIRFLGFEDEWESQILGEIAEYSKGQGYSKNDLTEEGTPIILYGRLYTNYESTIFEADTYTTPKPGSVFSSGREVIIPASGETAEDIARASYVKQKGVILGGDLNILTPEDGINPGFLALAISNGKTQEGLSIRAQGKTVVHIHNDDIKEVYVSLPSDQKEQARIAQYFSQIDQLIEAQKRKCEKLIALKAACLDKMFPKKGSKVPELRFAGFAGEWEQRKLDSFVTFFNGLTYSPNDIRPSGTLVLRSSNVKDGEVVDADNVYVNPSVVNSENVQDGDIIVVVRNGSRALIGKHAEIKGPKPNTVIGAFMTGIRSEHHSFVNALLNTSRFDEEIAKNMGATINQITGYMFSKMEFLIPDLKEQDAIGAHFEQLDALISLHQRKLKKLQQLQQAMMHNMFV